MNQQEPLEKEEFQAAQDSTKPAEPWPEDLPYEHRDGKVVPMMKEYKPLQVSFVIFSIIVLALVFIGSTSNMWGLIE